jgi:hypothetical protein
VHTFSPTSTRYLHNVCHFLYNVQVHFLDYTLLMLELLNFIFLGLEAVEGARELSTSLG